MTGLLAHPVLLGALGAIFVALTLIAAVALGSATRRRRPEERVRRRLSIYTLTGRAPKKRLEVSGTALGGSAIARSAVELAGRVVSQRDLETMLGGRLEAAGVPMRAAEWLIVHTGTALVAALAMFLITSGQVAGTVIGLGAGLAGPWCYLIVKQSRRESAFLAALPDTLQLMAGSLRAGYSLPQAMDAVAREGQPPVAGEFNRALVEARLGVPADEALEGIANRLQSKDFGWVVMVIRVQRDVGGNLAEVLGTVADTLRERDRLRRQIKVLSAEGRLSAWILGLLPVVFALYLTLTRPDYLKPLYTDVLGVAMTIYAIVMLGIGAFWLSRVVRVEV